MPAFFSNIVLFSYYNVKVEIFSYLKLHLLVEFTEQICKKVCIIWNKELTLHSGKRKNFSAKEDSYPFLPKRNKRENCITML
jgi:hypothetical protein